MGERNVLRTAQPGTRRLERRASAQEEHPLDALESLEGYIARHVAAGDENRTLRESQLTVFQDIANHFRGGGLRDYVELPTGFGKTVIFREMVEALGRKALILVPAIDLAVQTEDKFTTFAPNMSIGKVFDWTKRFKYYVF